MALRLVAATAADLAECAGGMRWPIWSLIRAQADGGLAHAIRDEAGAALVCGGYFPMLEAGCAEAWFIAAPAAKARMVAIMPLIALTLTQSGYRAIRTVIETPAGKRIAKALGYKPYDHDDGREIWIWVC